MIIVETSYQHITSPTAGWCQNILFVQSRSPAWLLGLWEPNCFSDGRPWKGMAPFNIAQLFIYRVVVPIMVEIVAVFDLMVPRWLKRGRENHNRGPLRNFHKL